MPRRPPYGALALTALAALLAVGVLVLARRGTTGNGSSSTGSAVATSGQESGYDGAPYPAGISAPDFRLRNQYGQVVSLREYRGRLVLLSFLYSTCGDTCIVIAEQLRGALDELEEEHVQLPAVLIVSADPAADTPARVRRFLSEVSLSGRVQYLTGTPAQLRAVWHAYAVKPASVGAAKFDEYASVLLIDPSGEKRVLFESEELTPEGLSHDVDILAAR